MKLTTGILMMAMMVGGAPAQSAKPAPGSPAQAVKPAIILASKSNSTPATPAKPAAKPAAPVASVADNKLERVNVTRNGDDIRIEMGSREAVNAKATKLSSPARVVVELPATAIATAQTKIPVGNGGVKGVRIGMDGKTPPTTSVVVDLDQALAYELTPGPSDKFVLTLHTSGVAKNTAAPATKAPAPAAKPQTAAAKPIIVPPAPKVAAVAKTAAPTAKPAAPAAKQQAKAVPETKPVAQTKATPVAATVKPADAAKTAEAPKQPKPEEKKWAMNGKRDPFFSPVVQQQGGSGCSSGKKCLEIGNINLRGVVKSDAGFIAVVTNSLNKAYFLRENDPVFNGYVVKITGDSVVFQETVQDKLGKPFTREVVKRIFTPAV